MVWEIAERRAVTFSNVGASTIFIQGAF